MKQPHDRANAPALSDAHIGKEAGVSGDDHQAIRLWLRLLACSTQIEQQISQRLRTRFGTTLARFDYLAQLNRHPNGLRMKVLSRYLMVTGGNVTGLTDQLVSEGWVQREEDPDDRRALVVRLTPAGVQHFQEDGGRARRMAQHDVCRPGAAGAGRAVPAVGAHAVGVGGGVRGGAGSQVIAAVALGFAKPAHCLKASTALRELSQRNWPRHVPPTHQSAFHLGAVGLQPVVHGWSHSVAVGAVRI